MSDLDWQVAILIDLYRIVHRELREELVNLPEEALNWRPGPSTNSPGTLVAHMLSSEIEMWQSLLELPNERDRAAEFAAHHYSTQELTRYLDAADAALAQIAPRVTVLDLQALRTRPDKPAPQPGLFWLVRNYGHAREHLAHLQFTRQLYFQLKV